MRTLVMKINGKSRTGFQDLPLEIKLMILHQLDTPGLLNFIDNTNFDFGGLVRFLSDDPDLILKRTGNMVSIFSSDLSIETEPALLSIVDFRFLDKWNQEVLSHVLSLSSNIIMISDLDDSHAMVLMIEALDKNDYEEYDKAVDDYFLRSKLAQFVGCVGYHSKLNIKDSRMVVLAEMTMTTSCISFENVGYLLISGCHVSQNVLLIGHIWNLICFRDCQRSFFDYVDLENISTRKLSLGGTDIRLSDQAFRCTKLFASNVSEMIDCKFNGREMKVVFLNTDIDVVPICCNLNAPDLKILIFQFSKKFPRFENLEAPNLECVHIECCAPFDFINNVHQEESDYSFLDEVADIYVCDFIDPIIRAELSNLRHLTIKLRRDIVGVFPGEFPKLWTLDIEMEEDASVIPFLKGPIVNHLAITHNGHSRLDLTSVKNLIMAFPQISELTVEEMIPNFSFDITDEIVSLASQLRELHLTFIHSKFLQESTPVHFPQLRRMSIENPTAGEDFKFSIKAENLKRVYIHAHQQLVTVSGELPGLKRFHVESRSEMVIFKGIPVPSRLTTELCSGCFEEPDEEGENGDEAEAGQGHLQEVHAAEDDDEGEFD
jgi:hypothetical protein